MTATLVAALLAKGWMASQVPSSTRFTVSGFSKVNGKSKFYTFDVEASSGMLKLLRITGPSSFVVASVPAQNAVAAPFLTVILETVDADLMPSMPQAAAPAAGSAAVGTLLTTVAEIDALPTYSVIGLGYQAPNGSYKARVFVREPNGSWQGHTFGASPSLGGEYASQDLLPSEKDWAAVVLRVGDVGSGLSALLAPVVAAHNIDPTATYYPLGA
jgi:hypothetical protein